jgi:hypothetical protein
MELRDRGGRSVSAHRAADLVNSIFEPESTGGHHDEGTSSADVDYGH